VSDLPPTPNLAALVEELRAQVGGLRSANGRLREVVVGKDECWPARRGRKPGGQSGHPGSGLEVSDKVDQVESMEPAECSTGGQPLDEAAPDEGFTPVQMWDIPPIQLKVTQFDLVRRRCPAGHLTQAAPPPAGVAGPVCYGPNLRAAVTQIAYLGRAMPERPRH